MDNPIDENLVEALEKKKFELKNETSSIELSELSYNNTQYNDSSN